MCQGRTPTPHFLMYFSGVYSSVAQCRATEGQGHIAILVLSRAGRVFLERGHLGAELLDATDGWKMSFLVICLGEALS